MEKAEIIETAVGTKDKYCEGWLAAVGRRAFYIGLNFTVAKTVRKFSFNRLNTLDKINAFDLAELRSACLGKINMMTVSSFCGPDGLIWGYDVCPDGELVSIDTVQGDSENLPVFDISAVEHSFQKLLGTIAAKRFPFYPGTLVPCACFMHPATPATSPWRLQPTPAPPFRSVDQ